MYTQVFGNYLLNTGLVTREQLLAALEAQTNTRVNLGAWAVHKGYMTTVEAQRIFILQTHQDKLFGELAVEEGYMSQDQVDELLQAQNEMPGYVLLGQILVEQGVLTPLQLENLINGYQSEFEIYDLDENEEQNNLIHHLLANVDEEDSHTVHFNNYLILFFNNLIRFIGDDFTPLNFIKLSSVPTTNCIAQQLECDIFRVDSALDMEADVAVAFASRYAQENFEEYDEYVRASMEDYLNLHNGLFVVNTSNEYSLEVSLHPPREVDNGLLDSGSVNTYIFPVLYPFGTVRFILSIYFVDNKKEGSTPTPTPEKDISTDDIDIDLDMLLDEVSNEPTMEENLDMDLDELLSEITAEAESQDEEESE